MKYYVASTVFAALASVAAGSAMALDVPCSTCELFPPITNVQTFEHGFVKAEVNAHIATAVGNVKVAGTAVGNNLSIDAGAGTTGKIVNTQSFAGYGDLLSSTVNVTGTTSTDGGFGGKLTVDNTAVANNASIKLGACCTTAPAIENTQILSWDRTAVTNVQLASVTGATDINTTAVGNNLSVEGRIGSLSNNQTDSWASIQAISNVTLGALGAGLTIATTAVGNNASWKQTVPCPVIP
ncbi:MAG: hypothetical protein WCO83_02910 [Alphaproteobacteria bacterium]